MSPEIAIGVDAGGTKTVARLVVEGRSTDVLRIGGPAQPYRDGVEKAANVVEAVVRELIDRSGAQPRIVACGIAGVADDERRTAMTAALGDRLGLPVFITTDVAAALCATAESGPAAALIAGTGSIAAFRASDGSVTRAGGLGLPDGDPGSGPWIARRCRRHDDGAAVDRAAGLGDAEASAALAAAAEALVAMVDGLVPSGTRCPLGLVGGVLEGSAAVREAVIAALRRTRPGLSASFPAVPPEVGAVRAEKCR